MPIPILVDTDIGTDIDDAFALALVLKSPELNLLGVTTVSGDTQARARLAAKLLSTSGRHHVPVAAGEPGKPLPIAQTRWASNFASRQLLRGTAVQLLDRFFSRYPRRITLVAIGPLTNIAALLKQDTTTARKIRRIVMMGGSIARGYDHHSRPDPEYNIVSDIPAARIVFSSGVPIVMAPLDVTAMLALDAQGRQRVFGRNAPLNQALGALYRLWGHPIPILYDPMAVALLINPHLGRIKPLAISVDGAGYTRVQSGSKPDAMVALHTDPAKFFALYLSRVAP
jgi:purine nucleosidase